MDFGKRGNLICVKDLACPLLVYSPGDSAAALAELPSSRSRRPERAATAWCWTRGAWPGSSAPAVLGFKIPRSVLFRIPRFSRFGNTPDGRQILFVAHPDLAPPDAGHAYARPDDVSDNGQTWRARLLAYNSDQANPLNFLPAYRLYAHDAYRALVEKCGITQVFILSAGWGLIRASFLTPDYDITFSASAAKEPWKRRRQSKRYEDFAMMPDDGVKILFLGGKDYLPVFCRLAANHGGGKTVLYNSAQRRTCRPFSGQCGLKRGR